MANISLRRSSRLMSAIPTLTENAKSVAIAVNIVSKETQSNTRPTKRTRGPASQSQGAIPQVDEQDFSKPEEVKRKPRKRNREPPLEPTLSDFATRVVSAWKVGPHVSSAGGVENAVANAAAVGANAFAIFLKSQRKWTSTPLTEHSVATFKARMKAFGYSAKHVLPHGSYLVNLGNPDEAKREKSYQCFLDDLKRCEQLDLELYNFHPGSTVGQATVKESLGFIAECINRAHKETERVVIVLENMVSLLDHSFAFLLRTSGMKAGSGNVIGSEFSELGRIIDQVDDKSRVGVCLDTCHMFAAGYDIRTQEGWESTMAEFERDVGLQYLRGMHLNDSKGALGSKKDRHENIGIGELGLATFSHVLSDSRTKDLPLILETPAFDTPGASGGLGATGGMDVWKTEVDVLNRIAMSSERTNFEVWKQEVGAIVKKASSAKDMKGKKKVDRAKGGKQKKKTKGDEDDGKEEYGSCAEDHEDA
ncbi:uncharacterized protein FIBRA_07336 [Fibroporia radiculosa]|uniref:Apurinic-apyrimidinic endonuclease 1 n=1 Tax=Fibroporia radiculosa TaxID=599839 RepID=J4GE54_9APHY|nr:uncharacterized protein FIBRA_07336 [Fibroporia radiculosa]CCM05128.1 predicted protein [Fibroporia radiculosa]